MNNDGLFELIIFKKINFNILVILCEWIGVAFIILDFWTFTWDFENL